MATTQRGTTPERVERALVDPMALTEIAPRMYQVVTLAGESYRVDVEQGACTCPDFEYHEACCKHQIRARVEYETRAIVAQRGAES